MLADALRYLQHDDDWVRLTIIGGLLTFFGFLLVPLFVVAGYVLRVLRTTMTGGEVDRAGGEFPTDERPADERSTDGLPVDEQAIDGRMPSTPGVPGFEDWAALAVDGLKGVLVTVAYLLVPTIVGGFTIGFGVLAAVSDSGAVGVIGTLLALGGVLLTLALTLTALYVLPAALATFVETDRMARAFLPARLRPALTNRRYATGWVYALVTVVAANVVINVLVLFAGIGLLLAPFATFYASVMAAYIIGRTWDEMDPIETHESDQPMERPTV